MPVNKVRRRGSYAPLSAHYYKDDKVIRAGERAELLYVRGLAFCADVLNDGFISDAQLTHVGVGLSNVKARAKALVETGAWERGAGGYFVVAWLRWNKSRDDILDEARRDAHRKGDKGSDQPLPPDPPPGEARTSDPWDDFNATESGQIPFGNRSDSHGSANGFRPDSEPSRAGLRTGLRARPPEPEPEPEPEQPLPSGGGPGERDETRAPAAKTKTASRKRSARQDGHRIPDDWWPSGEDRRWVRDNCPNLAGQEAAITGEFVGYWRSKPGKDGRKLDWSLTFRNWMSRESRKSPSRRAKPSSADTARAGLDLAAQYAEAEAEAEQERQAQVHQLPWRGAS